MRLIRKVMSSFLMLKSGSRMLNKTNRQFLEDEKEANRGCFHLKLRYQHSKKAKNQAADIVNEIQEADSLIKK